MQTYYYVTSDISLRFDATMLLPISGCHHLLVSFQLVKNGLLWFLLFHFEGKLCDKYYFKTPSTAGRTMTTVVMLSCVITLYSSVLKLPQNMFQTTDLSFRLASVLLRRAPVLEIVCYRRRFAKVI